jgi:hypothetical protein
VHDTWSQAPIMAIDLRSATDRKIEENITRVMMQKGK